MKSESKGSVFFRLLVFNVRVVSQVARSFASPLFKKTNLHIRPVSVLNILSKEYQFRKMSAEIRVHITISVKDLSTFMPAIKKLIAATKVCS